uniref:Large ribosomal subunit protein uL24c n=1 Tax=Liagoropsis maxima TaxID=1653392 RepID=A0A1G4NVY0_9FLOR|nr:Ribosomal protein L24 [Liagoropsis maxima]SCW22828.1 Ribosomal protein L24 [Liagoropsis maxima]
MNYQRQRNKIHVKKGDLVKVISGNYKGQTGVVIKTFKRKKQIIVKNINMKTKHIRPKQEGETGQIVRQEAPIASSNVMLYDADRKIASRYKKTKNSSGIYERRLIKLAKSIN